MSGGRRYSPRFPHLPASRPGKSRNWTQQSTQAYCEQQHSMEDDHRRGNSHATGLPLQNPHCDRAARAVYAARSAGFRNPEPLAEHRSPRFFAGGGIPQSAVALCRLQPRESLRTARLLQPRTPVSVGPDGRVQSGFASRIGNQPACRAGTAAPQRVRQRGIFRHGKPPAEPDGRR